MPHYITWQGVFDIAWLLFLIIILGYFWKERRELVKAKSWLITPGRITHCEWTTVGHRVWPKIEYSYQINNQQLTGEYLFLDTRHNDPSSRYSRDIAYKVAVAYAEDKEINVYYNPNKPEQSALDVSIPVKLNVIVIMIFSLLLIHVGIILFHYWY